MTERENLIIALNGGTPEWIPSLMTASIFVGLYINESFVPPLGGIPCAPGPDMFGINWSVTEGTGYRPLPTPGDFRMTDITEWKKIVKIPDIESWDWEGWARTELKDVNPNEKLVTVFSTVGPFERLAAFMGFENALFAMVDEPDTAYEFFGAIADLKIAMLRKCRKQFGAECYVLFDDTATANSLFVSPKMYRKLLKPHHRRIMHAARDCGMIPIMHTCGKCEDIVDDYVKIGAQGWNSAQVMNDINGLKTKYSYRFSITGGMDSSGPSAFPWSTEEDVRAEVRKAINTYAPGGGYIFMNTLVGNMEDPEFFNKFMAMEDEVAKYGKDFYKERNAQNEGSHVPRTTMSFFGYVSK